MAEPDLARMRSQWEQVIPGLRSRGWSDADLDALRTSCAAGMASGDPETVRSWAVWLDEKLRDLISQGCHNCNYRLTPGRSDGHCSVRDDLPPAYGTYHPLRQLPQDGGRLCTQWSRQS